MEDRQFQTNFRFSPEMLKSQEADRQKQPFRKFTLQSHTYKSQKKVSSKNFDEDEIELMSKTQELVGESRFKKKPSIGYEFSVSEHSSEFDNSSSKMEPNFNFDEFN